MEIRNRSKTTKNQMKLIIKWKMCFMAYGIYHFSSSFRLRTKNSIKTWNIKYPYKPTQIDAQNIILFLFVSMFYALCTIFDSFSSRRISY